jgi:outer membrane receptor protein involved in Fe transport
MRFERGARGRLLRSCLLLGCTASFPTIVFAEQAANAAASADTGAGGASTVQEVVVTAQFREQALIDVPQPVQALRGTELTKQGIVNLGQVINLIPGASQTGAYAPGTDVYQIRGVAPGYASGDATVGFYLDNFAFSVPGNPEGPAANIFDLQRVEVIRGPSGTLYGQGSLGGTIKVLTNDPVLDKWEGSYLLSGAGTADGGGPTATTAGMLNIPVIADKVAIRGVFEWNHLGGFVYYPNDNSTVNGNSSDEYFGHIKILAQPTDRLKIILAFVHDYAYQDHGNQIDGIDPPIAFDFGAGNYRTEYSLYTGDIHYDLGFANLLSSTGYLFMRQNIFTQGETPETGRYLVSSNSKVKSLQQEVRLTSENSSFFNWTVGGFYRDSDLPSVSEVRVVTPPIDVLGNNVSHSRAWAIYGEASLNLLGGALVPTVGGRYFSDDRRLDENSETIIGGTPPTVLGPFLDTVTASDHSFSPHFNLAYHPSKDSTVYVEVAKGFRSGALQAHSVVAALDVLGVQASPSLGPDTLWNYEIGAKWQTPDHRLQLDLAAYYYNWTNAQLQFEPNGAITAIIEVGDIHGRGVDVSAVYKPPIVDNLTLSFTGNFNNTTLANVPAVVTSSVPFLKDGEQAPGAPKTNLSAVVDYRYPLDNGWALLANARYLFRSKQRDAGYGNYSGDLSEGFLRLGVDTGKHLQFYIYADNVGNDRGPIALNYSRSIMPYPRTIGVSLQGAF